MHTYKSHEACPCVVFIDVAPLVIAVATTKDTLVLTLFYNSTGKSLTLWGSRVALLSVRSNLYHQPILNPSHTVCERGGIIRGRDTRGKDWRGRVWLWKDYALFKANLKNICRFTVPHAVALLNYWPVREAVLYSFCGYFFELVFLGGFS